MYIVNLYVQYHKIYVRKNKGMQKKGVYMSNSWFDWSDTVKRNIIGVLYLNDSPVIMAGGNGTHFSLVWEKRKKEKKILVIDVTSVPHPTLIYPVYLSFFST